MASGDYLHPPTDGSSLIVLLDAIAATGTDDGVWVATGEYDTCTVIATGHTGAAIVEVDGSNALAKPANNTHGITLAASTAGTALAFTSLCLPRWIKARISTLGTGTATAIAQLRRA